MDLHNCAVHLAKTVQPKEGVDDFVFLYLLTETDSAYQINLRLLEDKSKEYLTNYQSRLLNSSVCPVNNSEELSPEKIKTSALLCEWITEGQKVDKIKDFDPRDRRMNTTVDVFTRICGKLEHKVGTLPDNSNRVDEEDTVGLSPLVREYKKRIEYGVHPELLELAGIRGIGRNRARRLYERGVEDRQDLRDCDKYVAVEACRGDSDTAEKILVNVGRRDPEISLNEVIDDSDPSDDLHIDTGSEQANVVGNPPEDWDELRKRVYFRDDYRCQNCGRGGGPNGSAELHAHHIVPKSRGGNNKLSNLITLCSSCHNNIHPNMKE
jgi:replicative superfamily II helicase